MNTEVRIPSPTTALNQILSSAVVLNWGAVASQPVAMLRLEYHVGQDRLIENLKLWSRSRDYWSLVCDYTPNAGWADGPRFANGYHSRSLGRLFQAILMNQNRFWHKCDPNTNATLEICAPTAEDTSVASDRVNEVFPRTTKASATSPMERAGALLSPKESSPATDPHTREQ